MDLPNNLNNNDGEWKLKITQYCEQFNIPIGYLSDVLYDPKVTPMIRGKSFEFSAMLALRTVLPQDEWVVSKPILNPQLGFHDMDIMVKHKPTDKTISVECKLSKKEGYRKYTDGHSEISIKCMRSRTLGQEMVKNLSKKWKIPEDILSVHNDQYLPDSFDIVITSIGNAFYRTNPETDIYECKPNASEIEFLNILNLTKNNNLKDFAFNKMYLSTSNSLIASKLGTVCRRRKCIDKNSCPFIPNYPRMLLDASTLKPTNNWYQIEEAATLFKTLLA